MSSAIVLLGWVGLLLVRIPTADRPFNMFSKASTRERRLERQLADALAEIETLRRQLRIAEVENESLSLVIARDRERVKAELATFAKQTATNE